jgi:uncharacterized membrane protein
MQPEKPLGVPEMGAVQFAMLGEALRRGWADMKRAPGYALVFAGVYVAVGWIMAYVTWVTGQTYWLIFAVVSFPLIGPFAAVGFYEVSHLCAVIIILFLFWFFLAHMIFALFLGFSTMTNISTSYEVYLTREGLTMLAFGTLVGAGFAVLLYNITVIALPLLLDREVDFVTAMITSFQVVTGNPVPMLAWAAFIAVVTFVAMLPGFLGLFIVLPLLGHATWHLYCLIAEAGAQEAAVM